MILVTVGTEQFLFNRLMQWLDRAIAQKLIQPEQEEIVIQYGSCTLVPQGVKGYSVLKETEFLSLVEQARIIVAHCGEGTLDLLANITKPFILIPRTSKFQEHVDDHQLELAEQLAKLGIPIANSLEDLVDFIASPQTANISISPTQSYAQASFLLEEQFETDAILKDLTEEMVSDFVPVFA